MLPHPFLVYRGFGRAFNRNSTQMKTNVWPEAMTDVFSSVLLSSFNIAVRICRQRTEAVEGECTGSLRTTTTPSLVLVIQCMGPF